METTKFDVVILGSGMSGSVLGSILARHKARVLIVDAAKHPRFAIGESTIPETTKFLKILGDRFDIPEFTNLSSFIGVRSKISRNCGLKRNFGFVYHRQGQPQNPDEIYQAVLPDAFEGPEIHYFRQDVDAYLFEVAQQYGATVRENTRIADVNISEHGVSLVTTEGETFEAQYVVDGSGYRSVLAYKFGLRENPSRFKTHSRSIFTHMIDVKAYEDCLPAGYHDVPRKWSQGTLHHCFDGGWMWVIPFNNGPECPNSLVSVGLQLDTRKFPNRNLPAQEEFDWFLSLHPSIAVQFESAKAVRNWVSTGDRMQYSSKQTVGDRYCLTSHASGALGPLYSRGLASTMTAILPLAEELLDAIEDGDFSAQRFDRIEQLQQRTLDNVDSLVGGSYTAWQSFELWNAWVRIWYTSIKLGHMHIQAVHEKYRRSRAPQDLREVHLPHVGSFCPGLDAYQEFFSKAVKIIDAVRAEELSSSNGATQIFELIQGADFIPPAYNLSNPESKHTGQFDFEQLLSIAIWGNYHAPKDVKEKFFSGSAEENLTSFKNKYEEYTKDPRVNEIRQFLENTSLQSV